MDIPDEVFEQALVKYLAGSCVAEKVTEAAREQLIWGNGPRLVDRILFHFTEDKFDPGKHPGGPEEWANYKALLDTTGTAYEEADRNTTARSLVFTFENPANPAELLADVHARERKGASREPKDAYQFTILNGQRRSLDFEAGYPVLFGMGFRLPALRRLCEATEGATHFRIVDYRGDHYGSPEAPIQLGPQPGQ